MSPKLLARVVLVVLAAAPAAAAPTASFTARPIQGAVCVAPCAVHFDAIGNGGDETTDPDFDREFHSLYFDWDFGDPGAGTWSVSGASKNSAIGAVAGHLYDNPGVYAVRLTVTNPNGEAAETSSSVTVTDPDAHFTDAETFCFANDDLDWTGCPLDCSGGDDNCTVINDFDLALDGGDDCSGNDDCGRVSTAKQRLLFRRGDRFSQDSVPPLVDSTAPGLITAFGPLSNPLPVVSGGTLRILGGGDGWTFAHFEADRSDGWVVNMGLGTTRGFTVYDIFAHGYTEGCFNSDRSQGNTSWSQRIAVIELRCTRAPGLDVSTDRFLWGQYMLTMGGYSDNSGDGEFVVRTLHQRWSVIQHMELRNPGRRGGARNTLQFRAWDNAAGAARSTEDNKWNIVSDNHFINRGDSSTYVMRVCEDSGCNCPAGCDAGGNGAVENEDLIVERNFFTFDVTAPTSSVLFGIESWGGDQTFRNNVADYRGGMIDGAPNRFVTARGSAHPNATNDDNIHVYNNTVYFNDTYSGDFVFCYAFGADSGLFCRNNLLYAPNNTGQFMDGTSGFTASNNLNAIVNPFLGPVPSKSSVDKDDFRIASPNPGVIDTGYDFSPGSDRDRWVHDDAYGGCRPATPGAGNPSWDIGAHEVGAVSCIPGASGPPFAPILLP
jgi:PKD repeat protein